jgi:hypothetical protein
MAIETVQPIPFIDEDKKLMPAEECAKKHDCKKQAKIELSDAGDDSDSRYSDKKTTSQPSTFLLWSIFGNLFCWSSCGLTLFCSCPALVFSLLVRSHGKNDDMRRANRFSRSAYIFNMLTAIFLVLAFSLFYVFNLKTYFMPLFSSTVQQANSTDSRVFNGTQVFF